MGPVSGGGGGGRPRQGPATRPCTLLQVKDLLDTKPHEVMAHLEALRQCLTSPARMRVQCVGPMPQLAASKATWLNWLPPRHAAPGPLLPDKPVQLPQALLKGQANRGVIAGVAGTESSYLVQTGKGVPGRSSSP